MKNEMLALILAGGQGHLSENSLKYRQTCSFQFGGRYRIIDFFALSKLCQLGSS